MYILCVTTDFPPPPPPPPHPLLLLLLPLLLLLLLIPSSVNLFTINHLNNESKRLRNVNCYAINSYNGCDSC